MTKEEIAIKKMKLDDLKLEYNELERQLDKLEDDIEDLIDDSGKLDTEKFMERIDKDALMGEENWILSDTKGILDYAEMDPDKASEEDRKKIRQARTLLGNKEVMAAIRSGMDEDELKAFEKRRAELMSKGKVEGEVKTSQFIFQFDGSPSDVTGKLQMVED